MGSDSSFLLFGSRRQAFSMKPRMAGAHNPPASTSRALRSPGQLVGSAGAHPWNGSSLEAAALSSSPPQACTGKGLGKHLPNEWIVKPPIGVSDA